MKKQYVVAFKNTNPRMNQTVRYLTRVEHRTPYKTDNPTEATVFGTKAVAREVIASISKSNLYAVSVEIIAL